MYQVNPPLETISSNCRIVLLGFESENRQLEPALAVLAGVAGPLVTAGFREQRLLQCPEDGYIILRRVGVANQ